MAVPDSDLPTLIKRQDHLGILRYIRAYHLREPELVLKHGKALLGQTWSSKVKGDEAARLAALEQVTLAALDLQQHHIAKQCLSRLKEAIGHDNDNPSVRYRVLLGRCYEAQGDLENANQVYDEILVSHPSNAIVRRRKYCMEDDPIKRVSLLNEYLQYNLSDSAGWFELSRLLLSLGDAEGAAFALEEVVLGCPLESSAHIHLAEVYATIGGMEHLVLARKHMAQALELDPTNKRALWGLVMVSHAYLTTHTSKQSSDDHSKEVAKELIRFGADKLWKQIYQHETKMLVVVRTLLQQYTKDL
jgi:ER membrane protein complex subunit 2